MGVPIKDNQRVIGTLTVDRAWLKFDEEQSDDDLCILKMVADLIGQNVQRRRKIEGDRARLFEAQSRR
jgi:Nif-specific regulatory protein